ncbi:hypothetical protein ASPBRDRAFT_197773 [Aspergillus brasiliensis CBS 101740]|uniref:Uncharacterized protein n=1 Tax=Aspergillus brasiliensis (strain CBS 101740 / IMI 381727 / IBT 21946) TaxID=767769 RepID=A0A1L9UEH8_ASPBC|nr:hypothetical protein ASPBRDRAFT_197773 [Aspergillus brasiliensis CBS 101740]
MEEILIRLEKNVKDAISKISIRKRGKTIDKQIDTCFDLAKTETQKQQQVEKSSRPLKPVTTLKPEEIPVVFGISEDASSGKWNIPSRDRLPVPQHLRAMLSDIDIVTKGSPRNEAQTRTRIDAILISTLAAARKDGSTAQTRDSISSMGSVHSVHLQFEKDIHLPWDIENKPHMLSGRIDYSLWYGNPGDMEANLVVCEAKKQGESGRYQALGYMAMIHKARKMAGRKDTSVWGIATDSFSWDFLHLDNDQYTMCTYHWNHGQAVEVVSTLRKIIDHASGLIGGTVLGRKRTLEEASEIDFQSSM